MHHPGYHIRVPISVFRTGEEPRRVQTARAWTTALLVAAMVCLARPVVAVQSSPALGQAVSEALQLRASGDLAGSARLLRAYLESDPADPMAARLLAETLYWLKDFKGAREVYSAALVRYPLDNSLRLQYARMLMETGAWTRARDVLVPLQDIPGARAQAETLLGTLAYWSGDLDKAQRLFISALERHPDLPEARRQLEEIRGLTAAWIRAGSAVRHDDQPLDRMALAIEARWYATPLLPITVRVEPMAFALANSTRPLVSAEVAAGHFAPAVRLETELALGVVQRAGVLHARDWQGRAAVGLRLSPYLTLRARAERAPSRFTTSSLEDPIMTRTAAALLQWNGARGWLGEASYQRQQYPDANTVRTAYGWVLAPLLHHGHHGSSQLQAGYAFANADADASRFVFMNPGPAVVAGETAFNTAGRYVPYYTPSRVLTHSAIVAVTLHPSSVTTLRAGGSFGFRATDQAPTLVASPTQLQRTFAERKFRPWDARTSLDVGLRRGLTLTATGAISHTVFYTLASAGVEVTYRFVRPPWTEARR